MTTGRMSNRNLIGNIAIPCNVALEEENKKLKKENRRYRKALDEISEEIVCSGCVLEYAEKLQDRINKILQEDK